MQLLDVKIDEVTKKEALERVADFLKLKNQYKIFTPNPEMLVDAQKDQSFKEILNKGDLNLCDGFGLRLVSKGKLEKIAGTDFVLDICKMAEQKKYSVYFLGSGSDEVIGKLKLEIGERFSKLDVKGAHPGYKIDNLKADEKIQLALNKEENNDLIADIVMHAPDIIFVAFGHCKQEKWIDKYLIDLPSVKVAMGVGGAFDFLSGKVSRAPKFLQKLGLEWLYRLIREPKRFKRIFKATIVFLFYILKPKGQDL